MAKSLLLGPTCSSLRCPPKSAVGGQSKSVSDEQGEQMNKALDLGTQSKHVC